MWYRTILDCWEVDLAAVLLDNCIEQEETGEVWHVDYVLHGIDIFEKCRVAMVQERSPSLRDRLG